MNSREAPAHAWPLSGAAILLAIAAGLGLSQAPDLARSSASVCVLLASAGCAWILVWLAGRGLPVCTAYHGLQAVGLFVAMLAPLLMAFPPFSKSPLVVATYSHLPSPFPRWVNANYLGGTLAFFVPGAVLSAVYGQRHRVLKGLAGALMFGSLLLTQSRSALAGVVLVLIVATVRLRWVRRAFAAVAVAIAIVVLAGKGTPLLDLVSDRQTGRGIGPRLASRAAVWEQAVRITADYPLTGIGLRSYPAIADSLYPVYQGTGDKRVVFSQPHPHNLFLDVAVSLGFPGLVAYVALLTAWACMVVEVIRKAPRDPDGCDDRVMVGGLAGGMAAHLLFGLTDSISLGEKAGIFFWAIIGLTAAAWRRTRMAAAQQGEARQLEPGLGARPV